MKYLTDYIPATDTTEFENSMIAIIGDDASIPPVIVTGAKYYKCASVDTTTQTWSGYELVLTDGVYSVSETLTTGLTYTTIMPVAGTVYSEDALVKVAFYAQKEPVNGLVFYAPLNSYSQEDELNNNLTYTGSYSFGIDSGIPCVYLQSDGNSSPAYIDTNILNGPIVDNDISITFWFKDISTTQNHEGWTIFSYGAAEDNIGMNMKQGYVNFPNGDSTSVLANVFRFYCYIREGGVVSIYIGTTKKDEITKLTPNMNDSKFRLGAWLRNSGSVYPVNGKFAACRVYNRALTQDEINILANEFTPTTA